MERNQKDFRDLEVWQEAHRLTLEIYKITATFPKEEVYGLTSQFRRASVSVELNIAEGYGRHHYAEEINFLYLSRGSISETQSCLLISKDLKYVPSQKVELWLCDYALLSRRINSLIAYKRKRKARAGSNNPVI